MRVLIFDEAGELSCRWQSDLRQRGHDASRETTCDAALSGLRSQRPDVIVANLAPLPADAFLLADIAAVFTPQTRVVFVTQTQEFADGSVFRLAQNACAQVPDTIPPGDLTALVEYHGRSREN